MCVLCGCDYSVQVLVATRRIWDFGQCDFITITTRAHVNIEPIFEHLHTDLFVFGVSSKRSGAMYFLDMLCEHHMLLPPETETGNTCI